MNQENKYEQFKEWFNENPNYYLHKTGENKLYFNTAEIFHEFEKEYDEKEDVIELLDKLQKGVEFDEFMGITKYPSKLVSVIISVIKKEIE